MSAALFNRGARVLGDGTTVWTSASIRALLLKGSGYTFDPDHDFVSDLTPGSNEVTVSGYSRQTLSGKSITTSDAADRVIYDADDPLFAALAAGETITGMVLFDNAGGADSARVLLAYYPVNAPSGVATTGGDFSAVFSSDGAFYLSTV